MAAIVLLAAAPATAQTVRFHTSVGAFDMLLNPTNDANLQPLVDNLMANVAAGVYHRSVVNRAPDGFVLQLGGFTTDSIRVDEIPSTGFTAVDSFDPIIVDADEDGDVDFEALSNTRGTVSLALSAGNPNSGTSSFFISVGDSSFLDTQGFVPFATISDMATVDRIMGLNKIDISADVGQPGSLAFIDVPLAEDGELLVIEAATVVSDSNFSFIGPLLTAFDVSTDNPANGSSAASAASDGAPSFLTANETLGGVAPPASSSVGAIPEPTTLALAAMGLLAATQRRRRDPSEEVSR